MGEFVETRLRRVPARGASMHRLRPAVVRLREGFGRYPLAHARPFLDIDARELVRHVQQDVETIADLFDLTVTLGNCLAIQWHDFSRWGTAYRLHTADDCERLPFAPFDAADRFVVQEWIPGRDSDVYFCLTCRNRDGEEVAAQGGRKITQWRVDTGSTAFAITTRTRSCTS